MNLKKKATLLKAAANILLGVAVCSFLCSIGMTDNAPMMSEEAAIRTNIFFTLIPVIASAVLKRKARLLLDRAEINDCISGADLGICLGLLEESLAADGLSEPAAGLHSARETALTSGSEFSGEAGLLLKDIKNNHWEAMSEDSRRRFRSAAAQILPPQ